VKQEIQSKKGHCPWDGDLTVDTTKYFFLGELTMYSAIHIKKINSVVKKKNINQLKE
jgi:hypothetical protein